MQSLSIIMDWEHLGFNTILLLLGNRINSKISKIRQRDLR